MRTKLKANVIISNDTDGKNVLFGYDDTLSQETIDTYTGCVSGKLVVSSVLRRARRTHFLSVTYQVSKAFTSKGMLPMTSQ